MKQNVGHSGLVLGMVSDFTVDNSEVSLSMKVLPEPQYKHQKKKGVRCSS